MGITFKRRCDVMCDSNNLKTNFYCLKNVFDEIVDEKI